MIPDIVEIKRLCASGQWLAKIENGKILLHDTVAGETVCVGQTDAEPVRHGAWEWLGPNSMVSGCMCGTCSVCKVRSKYIVNVGICPNCGAKMDGKK